MGSIDYQIKGIDDAMSDLNYIKGKIASQKNNPALPSSTGGGNTVNKMEELAKVYSDLYTHLEELVNNTILFLNKTKTAIEEADRKAANGIQKGN